MPVAFSIGELVERFSLLQDLQFIVTGSQYPDSMPSLALLLAAGASREPGATCFMYPRSDGIVLSTAVLGALTRLRDEFPSLLETYARRGFERGQRVRVLPTGHIYEFDGLFENLDSRFKGLFFRLRVLDPPKRRWSKKRPTQATVRAFPVDQILRLQPTVRSSPRGKENTPLGAWRPSTTDRLIDIRTGGNTGLFRNHVLVLTSRAQAERYADTTSLISGRRIGLVAKAVTWGSIGDDGEIDTELGSRDEEPLVAVTHTIDLLAAACESAEPCSKLVLVDGLTALSRNIQAYDRIARRQRMVIVADHDDENEVQELMARGCQLWPLTAREILYGPKAEIATADNRLDAGHPGSLFREVRRSAVNAEAFTIKHILVLDKTLECTASALFEAERSLGNDPDEAIRRLLGLAFGALVQAASWFRRPDGEELAAFKAYLMRLEAFIDGQRPWAPQVFTGKMEEAVGWFRAMIVTDETGVGRLTALKNALKDLDNAGRRTAVVTKTTYGSETLSQLLSGLPHAAIYTPTTVTIVEDLDTLVVTSWLKGAALTRLINKHIASEVQVLGCPFELHWLSGTLTARQARQARWKIDSRTRAKITGVEHWAGDAGENSTDGSNADPGMGEEVAGKDPLRTLELWYGRKQKGSAPEQVPEDERREARYVGFAGRGYAYLTLGRSLPVVTDLVRGVDLSKVRVLMRNIDQLRPGEYILFRDQGDHDIIEQIAEDIVGGDKYRQKRKVAERWKEALRSIGATSVEIHRRLRMAGIRKHPATIRSWLLDPDKIGPGSRSDLDLIAEQAVQDRSFQEEVERVWEAIREIRGAHIAAGQRLSELLLKELPSRLPRVADHETYIELTLGHAWIVEIEEIGDLEERPLSDVNRLLWDNNTL